MNRERAKKIRRHLDLSFQKYPSEWDFVGHRNCALRVDGINEDQDCKVCDSYADHGHCTLGSSCPASHDIDLILDKKEGWKNRKRHQDEEEEPKLKKPKVVVTPPPSLFGGGHRAGFDAFMTAFVFAAHLSFRDKPVGGDFGSPQSLDMSEHANKVYLVSKDFPLLVRRSQFSGTSAGHRDKFAKIFPSDVKVQEEEDVKVNGVELAM